MKRRRTTATAKALVWLWYVPILIVLGVTGLVSYQNKAPAGIVDKARVFQDVQEASRPLEKLGSQSYDFKLALNQDFTLKGKGVNAKGSFRDGDRLEVPFDLTGLKGKKVSSVRGQLLNGKDGALLPGLKVTVRSCETPWKKEAVRYTCSSTNHIQLSTSKVTDDTFALMDADEELEPSAKKHLLLQFTVEEDILVPVKGYATRLKLLTTGLAVPAKA